MLLNKKFLISLFLLSWCLSLVLANEDFNYNPKGKRNPFVPLVTPEGRLLKLDKQENVATNGLAIEGIIYDKLGRSFAIVNAMVVGIGDQVGDFKVLNILENKVIFIKDGEALEVELTKTSRAADVSGGGALVGKEEVK
ncbi:MAG: hypothetical protein COV73_06275 [Candidatus Omnitrophica bacterium CG11_big_fil_rev_8_21_14_0_20_43_6]|nr:MAG: hypothetical protein COV73_06275 [Candidatus Omnitrophica bacterium CG11_big_fil_rev_8_21_14_0_20_43_6]